jgi:hypothetical protein
LLGCVSFAGDPIRYARVLGLVSFDCHPGSPFFSDRRCTLLLLIYVFSFRHHSFSLRRRPLPFRQQHLLYLLRRSLARSLFSDVPAGLSCSPLLAAHALRIALIFLPRKAGAAVGRSAACVTANRASRCRPRRHPKSKTQCPLPLRLDAALRTVAAAATPPPILLIGYTRLVESPCQGGN